MPKNYQIVSPSLDGILFHESLTYEGIRRPVELMRVLDAPSNLVSRNVSSVEDRKVMEKYLHDLHTVFMKRFSDFIVGSDVNPADNVKLQAMLQEMIKVKGMLSRHGN